MYTIHYTTKFKRDIKRCAKRGLDIYVLRTVIFLLQQNGKLPARYRPHRLTGNFAGCWECHIQPDWLLIWRQNDKELTMLFTDTGTHSDLF